MEAAKIIDLVSKLGGYVKEVPTPLLFLAATWVVQALWNWGLLPLTSVRRAVWDICDHYRESFRLKNEMKRADIKYREAETRKLNQERQARMLQNRRKELRNLDVGLELFRKYGNCCRSRTVKAKASPFPRLAIPDAPEDQG